MPKTQFKKFVLLATAVLVVSYLFLIAFFVRPEAVRQNLVHAIEEWAGEKLTYQKFRMAYFPLPHPVLENFSLTSQHAPEISGLKAQRLVVNLSLWSYLFGRLDISSLQLQNAEATLNLPLEYRVKKELRLSRVNLKAHSIPFKPFMKFELSGDLDRFQKAFVMKGQGSLGGSRSFNWNAFGLKSQVQLRNVALESLFTSIPLRRVNATFQKGTANGTFSLNKISGQNPISIQGGAQITGLIYEMQEEAQRYVSPQMDLRLETDGTFDPAQKETVFEKLNFDTLLGNIEIKGAHDGLANKIRDFHIMVRNLALESLPQYYPPLKEAIPFNFGFSGLSNLEMTIEGAVDGLSLHANWDLTPSLLTYAGYFSKPKDLPSRFIFDAVLKDGKNLSGGFSLNFADTHLKGSLAALDFGSGEGQLTVITNKFQLKNWQQNIPVFQGYEVEGECKILATLTGNFLREPGKIKPMVNVTLENGALSKPNAPAVKAIFLSLDSSPLALEIKKAAFEISDEKLEFQLKVFDPAKNATVRFKARSQKINPSRMVNNLQTLIGDKLPENLQKGKSELEGYLQWLFPESQSAERFYLDAGKKDAAWILRKLRFDAYQGTVRLSGNWKSEQPYSYQAQLEVDRFNLTRFLTRTKNENKIIEGNLFVSANLQGNTAEPNWFDRMSGSGRFTITNGELPSVNLMEGISKISGFSRLSTLVSQETDFGDLLSDFTLSDKKLNMSKLVLVSKEFYVEGTGDVTWDGLLNYKMDVFLETPLVGELLNLPRTTLEGEEKKMFGPVPLLLSGPISEPVINANPALLPQLRENLEKKKSQKFFRSFWPEDFLFDRPSKS